MDRLTRYLEENNFINKSQAGWREGFSSTCNISALLDILEDAKIKQERY